MRPFYCLLSVSAVFWRFIHIVASFSTLFFFWMNHSPSCGYTGTPCFSQIHVPPLRFYGTPTLLPVFISRKRSEERFHFCGEAKSKTNVQCLCCGSQPAGRAAAWLLPREPHWHPNGGTPSLAPQHRPHIFDWATVCASLPFILHIPACTVC